MIRCGGEGEGHQREQAEVTSKIDDGVLEEVHPNLRARMGKGDDGGRVVEVVQAY